ncbi:MAG: SDR family NAD(P)-dependent oxidoreductase [Bacteroidota bacterium]
MNPVKTALITGANKGIGLQIAKDLAALHFHVILTARSTDRGEKATAEIRRQGGQASFVTMDVGQPDSIRAAFSQVKKMTAHLDVLINNAGVLLDENTPFPNGPMEDALKTMQINALGALWVTQAFMPLLKKGSRVIMVSSGAGTFCEGVSSYAPVYSISKVAMNAITRQLHRVLSGQGMLINAMCPGWVRTDMGGPAANRSVEKGAETAVWLATTAPGHINGKFLRDRQEISW